MGIFARLRQMKEQAIEAHTERVKEKTATLKQKVIKAEARADARKGYERMKARLKKARRVTNPLYRAQQTVKKVKRKVKGKKRGRNRKPNMSKAAYFGGTGGGPFG